MRVIAAVRCAGSRRSARGLLTLGLGLVLGLAGERLGLATPERPRVVLIEDPGETTILPRLRADLLDLGLDVVTVARSEGEQLPRDLVVAARDRQAVAAFRIVVEADRADVWIADRVTGKVVLRELLPRGRHIDGRVVALRAVELLRASLLEVDAGKPPSAEVPPPTLTETPGLLPDLERFSLAAESAVLWSPGGCGPGVGIAAKAAWRPTWIGVRLSGVSMLAPATLTVPDAGTGEIITRWLALDAIWQPRRTRLAWRPRVGLGVAMLATSLRGLAAPPRASRQQTVYTAAPIGTVDLGWAVHPRVRLSAGVAYLRPWHGVDILVAGAAVGRYGRDLVLGTLGLEVVLP
jgi:hypothetical protein